MPSPDLRTQPHLGLALGGGGALGAAHVGVLQVMHQRGIRPHIVAGTSAGSVIGAAYAAGYDPYWMEDLVLSSSWGTFGAVTFTPGLGVLDTAGLRASVEAVANADALIEDLPLKYAAVATNVRTLEPVVLDRGPVVDAMCASIAVPGLFRPTQAQGHLLVDGGVVQNLPLQTVLDMGAEHVIGVRLAAEWDMGGPIPSTTLAIHELEIDRRVTLVTPRLGRRSQWVAKDLPGLIQLGREAAERAFEDYPVVLPRA